MKRIADYSGLFTTDPEFVQRLLARWQPSASGLTEKAYELELLGWLKKQLPDVPMIAQYGIAKGQADIVIEDLFLIELKRGFGTKSSNEFNRCIGQLEQYQQTWVKQRQGFVYLLVVGDSDVHFRQVIHTWFEKTNDVVLPTFFHNQHFYLIEKSLNT